MSIFLLLNEPPGSLVYHLVMLFVLGTAAAMALGAWRRARDAVSARLALAAGVMFLLRLASLALAFLAALSLVDGLVLVPPFDRAASSLSLLLIIWLFAFPTSLRLADAGLGLLAVLITIALLISWGLWAQQALAVGFYNGSRQETAWEVAQMALILAGFGLLAWRRQADWLMGAGLLALLMAGHIVHYTFVIAGTNLPGAERAFEFIAMPVLAAAIYRRAHPFLPLAGPAASAPPEPAEAPSQPAADDDAQAPGSDPAIDVGQAAPPAGADLNAMLAFAALPATIQPAEFIQTATLAVAHALSAPLCLFLTPGNRLAELQVRCAYSPSREAYLDAAFELLRDAPESLSALASGQLVALQPGTTERNLHGLARKAWLEKAGPVLFAPMLADDQSLFAALAVVSDPRALPWSPEHESLLLRLASHLSSAWLSMQTRQQIESALHELNQQLARARQEAERQQEQAQVVANQLQLQRRAEAVQAEQLQAYADLRASYEAVQTQLEDSRLQERKLRDELDLVRADLVHVSEQAAAAAARTAEVQETAVLLEAISAADARQAQQAREIAELRRALADSERQLGLALSSPATPADSRPAQTADTEVIASLTQELRQPMSSIVGYSDLLLSESVGILGALQRKFLERIKASSERIGTLLEDLMRVMDIDSGNLNLEPENVDVLRVIDDALHGCATLFQEKNLQLVREIAPDLPAIHADRDALLQIFQQLLTNCAAASANDTQCKLVVNRETDQRPGGSRIDYLVISVTDTGSGIAVEDQPRVFARLYRADAPLIAGLGDNGMGLSIAKALIEGHGGRIWVVSEPGAGSTFYVLLPIHGRQTRANGIRAAHA
jgi:signal transduction histidine kinase